MTIEGQTEIEVPRQTKEQMPCSWCHLPTFAQREIEPARQGHLPKYAPCCPTCSRQLDLGIEQTRKQANALRAHYAPGERKVKRLKKAEREERDRVAQSALEIGLD